MANEDNTRQMNQANGNSNNGQNEEVLAAIRALDTAIRALDAKLDARVDSLDTRLTSVEQIILARLNDTRSFEQQMMARLNEMSDKINELSAGLAAMREDLEKFRAETNQNFRLVSQKLEHLNNDFLHIRAEHTLLEKRVSRLEERAA